MTLALDVAIAFLLLVTIGYCWKLSKRITLLHQGKEDLNHFIKDFNNAIIRAEDNIVQLKELGSETDEKLREDIRKARFLANDLSFLMDKGENVADTLEHFISTSRGSFSNPPGSSRTGPTSTLTSPGARRAANNIAPEQEAARKKSLPSQQMTPTKKQALDDVLSQIAARKAAKPQSKAEATTSAAANNGEGGMERAFNPQRIKQSLKATQRVES